MKRDILAASPPLNIALRAVARIPTDWGEFQLFLYEDDLARNAAPLPPRETENA